MTSFFRGIEDLFVNHLFWPMDQLRHIDNWWGANFFNWILFLIGCTAFIYWMLQLNKFDESGEENTKSVATTWPYE